MKWSISIDLKPLILYQVGSESVTISNLAVVEDENDPLVLILSYDLLEEEGR